MTETYELPFDLNAESVGAWLNSIDRLSDTEKVNVLNPVLSGLSTMVVEAEVLVLVLDKLTAVVLMQARLIEKMALGESYTSEKSQKWLAAATRLPKKLAQAYARLATDNATPEPIRAISIFIALQILAELIKRTSLTYEVQDAGYWNSFAELYSLASSHGILLRSINQRIPGLISHPNIESVAKQILLFDSCHPYELSRSDINSAFSVSAELSQWVKIKTEASDYTVCRWLPISTELPQVETLETDEEKPIYLDSFNLIDYFDHYPENWDIYRKYPMTFDRMTAYYDIRRSVNPSNTRKCGLIIGSVQAEKFLNILISRYRILELSDALQDKQAEGQLELVPLESGNKLMASLATKILSDDRSFAASRLSVYETDHADFCVAKIGNLRCSLNEPVILAYEGQQPCLGVIRHLRVEPNVKLKNLLIERILGAVYPVDIDGNRAFIVFRTSNRGTELFLPSGQKHGNRTVLKTAKGVINKTFVIDKFIEMNVHFSRYQVSIK